MEYWGRAWADYIVTIPTKPAVLVMSLHCCSTSTKTCMQGVKCYPYVDMNVSEQQYSSAHQSFPDMVSDSHRHVGKLPGSYSFTQCLSRLNSFILFVCLFTYLSPSIIFTAQWVVLYYYSRPCYTCSCNSCTWARQYTKAVHGVFQGVHGSREPGCDKCGVNDT